ncbi:MAG: CoA-binding protein [Methanobacteriota archaeon]|nr:MAG: CoA-binding protein [Euryarchaeota archaeon]
MKRLFNPSSIAVVGVSANPAKVGSTIFLNLINNGYGGKVYAVNPHHKELFGKRAYAKVSSIEGAVDVVVIATPASTVPSIIRDAKKKTNNIIVISGGFGESGNKDLEKKLKRVAPKNMVGPNCLGIYSAKSKFDTLFFAEHKLPRPPYGDTAIISQSGGVGSTILGLAAKEGVGIHSFVSYGNGYVLDESDFLMEYARNKEVGKILLYIEGVKDGRKFSKALAYAQKRKPVIVLKAGKQGKAKQAATTHTGAIAGSYLTYKAVFKKARVVEAESFEKMFDYAKIFSQPRPNGNRLAIITNGGGLGVMAADEAVKLSLELPQFTPSTTRMLRKSLPSYVSVNNPLDVVADAAVERYKKSLQAVMEDRNIDMVLVNILLQPPGMDTSLVETIRGFVGKKPLAVVVPGGMLESTLRRMLTQSGIPTYPYPERGVDALYTLYSSSKTSPTL